MAQAELSGLKVAILVTDGFEQVELEKPRKALDKAGAETRIVSPTGGLKVKAWDMTDWGSKFKIALALSDARAEDFDALLLPGGVINPDELRIIPEAVAFVKAFFDAGKPSPRSAMGRGRVEAGRAGADDLVAVAQDRPAERRGRLGGRGGGGGREPGDQPQAGRHPRLQPGDDRPVQPCR